MDIKEIIKWFIPCFHILLAMFVKMDTKLTFIFLILFFNSYPTFGAQIRSDSDVVVSENYAKNIVLNDSISNSNSFNQSEELTERHIDDDEGKSMEDTSVGRTFGRPFKKMMAGLMPLIFQIGAASTWAVLAALVGVKTLFVTLAILKLLLVAGALKAGVLLGSKGHGHQSHGWEPPHPQKEIHLHIHNGQHGVVEHPPTTWNRNEVDMGTKNFVIDPYAGQLGPQTISTPYGNYVKID